MAAADNIIRLPLPDVHTHYIYYRTDDESASAAADELRKQFKVETVAEAPLVGRCSIPKTSQNDVERIAAKFNAELLKPMTWAIPQMQMQIISNAPRACFNGWQRLDFGTRCSRVFHLSAKFTLRDEKKE